MCAPLNSLTLTFLWAFHLKSHHLHSYTISPCAGREWQWKHIKQWTVILESICDSQSEWKRWELKAKKWPVRRLWSDTEKKLVIGDKHRCLLTNITVVFLFSVASAFLLYFCQTIRLAMMRHSNYCICAKEKPQSAATKPINTDITVWLCQMKKTEKDIKNILAYCSFSYFLSTRLFLPSKCKHHH